MTKVSSTSPARAFQSYPSFEVLRKRDRETYSQWSVIATEKLHGSNFCVAVFPSEVEGELPTIQCAKRTGWLTEEQPFFCWQEVIQRYKEKVLRLFLELKPLYPNLTGITIFGELYGGSYEHPEVAPHPTAKSVQKRVWYRPDNDFAAFDVRLSLSPGVKWLAWDEMKALCDSIGIPTVPEIARASTLQGLLEKHPELHERPSAIPNILGLPLIDFNVAEGVVLRLKPPTTSTPFMGVDKKVQEKEKSSGGFNLRFKLKHSKFEEVAYLRTPNNKNNNKDNNNGEEERLHNFIKAYVTMNRVDALESKIGPNELLDKKLRGSHLATLGNDALEDLWKDFEAGDSKVRELLTIQGSLLAKKELTAIVKKITPRCFAQLLDFKAKEREEKAEEEKET